VALEFAAQGLKKAGSGLGALGSPHSTLEELYLLGKIARALGSESIDFRLRHADFSADGKRAGVPWLGMKIGELAKLDRVLVVGSFLRKDHPLLANRFRQAAKRGQELSVLHVADDDLSIALKANAVVAPGALVATLAQIVRAAAEARGAPVPAAVAGVTVLGPAREIAKSLASGQDVGLFLGNSAEQHPQAAQLHALVQSLAATLGARFGFLGAAANSVGGYLANCVPGAGGLDASAMLVQPRQAYLLLNVEPELDCHNSRAAVDALKAAEFVVALAAYRHLATEYADVMLPIAPFTETSGTFVSTEGRMQGFNGVVRPLGETRPAWKVLRVLGNLLGVAGFEYDTSEAIRDEACPASAVAARLDNRVDGIAVNVAAPGTSSVLRRVADVPIYFADPIVRRAKSLQETRDAMAPRAFMGITTLDRLGVSPGHMVRVKQEGGEAVVQAARDDRVPDGCVRLAAAHAATAGLGAMFGELTVERA